MQPSEFQDFLLLWRAMNSGDHGALTSGCGWTDTVRPVNFESAGEVVGSEERWQELSDKL